MTYFGFHLRFNLPLLVLLAFAAGPGTLDPGSLRSAGLVLAAVFLFTVPWDNFAAARGIWGFPRDRYSLRIGYLPVEEYLFFLIQAVEAMLLTRIVCDHLPAVVSLAPPPDLARALPWIAALTAVWAAIGIAFGRRVRPRHQYAWHLLYWFVPILAMQWVIGWQILAPRVAILSAVTFALGLYLSIADSVAIRRGIWWVNPKQTTGHRIGRHLPWEEAAFFFLTSLLVAQSYLLWLPEPAR
jgi:lycopene cyclase domain-containing protein